MSTSARLQRSRHVRSRRTDPFTLPAHMGEEARGSVQIVPEGVVPANAGAISPLTESNRARRVPGPGYLLVLTALALAALLLAGCTAWAPSPSPSATASAGLAGQIRPDANVPTDVPNTPALRANVQISSCERDGDGWKASGTARNPADADTTYTITVFFTTDKATVLGTGDTTVKVPAGESAEWEIRADLTPAPEMRCVLRGVGQ